MNWKAPLVVVAVLFAGYLAYPYLALHQLVAAVESGDPALIEPKVDWPAVRQGFKDDVSGAMGAKRGGNQDGGLSALGLALGARIMGGAIDAFVTPEGLAGIIQAGRRDKAAAAAIGGAGGLETTPAEAADGTPRHTHVVWAFFDGPASFTARIRGRGEADTDPPVRLRFELEGGRWMLTRVFLPAR